jgi:hypothetical protein
MSDTNDRRLRVITATLPAILLLVLCAHFLPVDILVSILTVLTAWTCAAIPVGVLVGHCALSEA